MTLALPYTPLGEFFGFSPIPAVFRSDDRDYYRAVHCLGRNGEGRVLQTSEIVIVRMNCAKPVTRILNCG